MIDTTTIKERRDNAGLSKSLMAKVLKMDRHTYAKRERHNSWYLRDIVKLDFIFGNLDVIRKLSPSGLTILFFLRFSPIERVEQLAQAISADEGFKEIHADILQLIRIRKEAEGAQDE